MDAGCMLGLGVRSRRELRSRSEHPSSWLAQLFYTFYIQVLPITFKLPWCFLSFVTIPSLSVSTSAWHHPFLCLSQSATQSCYLAHSRFQYSIEQLEQFYRIVLLLLGQLDFKDQFSTLHLRLNPSQNNSDF